MQPDSRVEHAVTRLIGSRGRERPVTDPRGPGTPSVQTTNGHSRTNSLTDAIFTVNFACRQNAPLVQNDFPLLLTPISRERAEIAYMAGRAQ